MITWLLIHLGIDDSTGPWYAFWSGFGSDLTELTIIWGLFVTWRHKKCVTPHCWRLGHIDPVHHHPACRKHHSHRKALPK